MAQEQPPALPGTLSRPDAQRIIDALNLRLWAVEKHFAATPVKGSRGGNEALASLLTALDKSGLIKDETTA
jgi:hypothetical protein